MKFTQEKLKELVEKYRYVLMVLAVGLCLLLLPASDTSEETGDVSGSTPQTISAEEWLVREEERLGAALAQIDGVGQALVMLTLENGPESVLASDTDGDREETVILSAGSGHQQTVTLLERSPTLQGALIICEGGGNDKVRLQVLEAVKALTGLGANQISICKGMGGE